MPERCRFTPCRLPAVWTVDREPYDLDDRTHACADHIGAALVAGIDHSLTALDTGPAAPRCAVCAGPADWRVLRPPYADADGSAACMDHARAMVAGPGLLFVPISAEAEALAFATYHRDAHAEAL